MKKKFDPCKRFIPKKEYDKYGLEIKLSKEPKKDIKGKKGQHYDVRNWSAAAVSIGVAGFMAFTGHTGWAIFFGILGIILAALPYL